MVLDERIGAVEDTLSKHDQQISALQAQHQLMIALLTEIRDEVIAHRSRLDRLVDAVSRSLLLVSAAMARAIDAVGSRLIIALLLGIAALLAARLGIDPAVLF